MSDARRILQNNLLKQRQLLQAAVRDGDPGYRSEAEKYEGALLALSDTLPRVTSVVTMRDFWERTSKLVEARNELLRKMEGSDT